MGVKEVWFWEDGTLAIYALQGDRYEQSSQSQLLPNLPLDLFCRHITYYDQYEAVQEFHNAIRK
jgi:hypothetical protein